LQNWLLHQLFLRPRKVKKINTPSTFCHVFGTVIKLTNTQ
jgi:hypothetical protein